MSPWHEPAGRRATSARRRAPRRRRPPPLTAVAIAMALKNLWRSRGYVAQASPVWGHGRGLRDIAVAAPGRPCHPAPVRGRQTLARGVSPGFGAKGDPSPGGAAHVHGGVSPHATGASPPSRTLWRAGAPVVLCRPLRGSECLLRGFPGLTPRATICRPIWGFDGPLRGPANREGRCLRYS